MSLLTPEQKAALDTAHATDETVALADAALYLAGQIKRTIKDTVPGQERLLAEGKAEMAAHHWQDTWKQLLVTIDAMTGTDEQKAAVVAAILTTYPGKHTQAGIVATATAMRLAVDRLANSTTETIAADLADVREAFSLLWR